MGQKEASAKYFMDERRTESQALLLLPFGTGQTRSKILPSEGALDCVIFLIRGQASESCLRNNGGNSCLLRPFMAFHGHGSPLQGGPQGRMTLFT